MAMSGLIVSSGPGRALLGQLSSCRPLSRNMLWISTVTVIATSSNSVPDILASTANNLKKDGWATGNTWGYEVVVPATFNFLLADHSRPMSLREWERQGIRRANGQPFPRPDEQAFLLVPAGVQGPGFLMLNNFSVIMKYNPAEAYALAIGHLADRLRGGGPFLQDWPRYERVLSRTERLGTPAVACAPWLRCG